MFRSCSLPILILLASSATAVQAREPSTIFGIGFAMSCEEYLGKKSEFGPAVLTWVQGYFSGLNAGMALHHGHAATVGGSVSAGTLESMLKGQCREEKGVAIWVAADRLYDQLGAKGL
jgi:hypothetical protein